MRIPSRGHVVSLIRRVLPLLTAPIAVACSTSTSLPSGGTSAKSVEGTWNVASVNGSPFPLLLPTVRGCALTGLSGTLAIRSDGRFTGNYSYRRQCRGIAETVNRAIAGRYSANGPNLVFAADSGFSKFASAPLVSGSVNGSDLTMRSTPAPGMTVAMVLRRR